MYTEALPWLLWLPILAVAGFAFLKGGLPERLGAGLKLFTSVVAFLIHLVFAEPGRSVALLVADGVLALGFLGLALMFASLWLGAAMLMQGGQFSLHAYYMVVGKDHDFLYALVNNVVTYGIVVCILLGTVTAWRRRVRARRRDAEEADQPEFF